MNQTLKAEITPYEYFNPVTKQGGTQFVIRLYKGPTVLCKLFQPFDSLMEATDFIVDTFPSFTIKIAPSRKSDWHIVK